MSERSLQKPPEKSAATASTADSNNQPWLSREQVRQIAAAMFRGSSVDLSKRNHAELSSLYASMVLIRKKSEEDRLTPQQRQIVDARVHTNMLQAIHQRLSPNIRLREEIQDPAERNSNDRDLQR